MYVHICTGDKGSLMIIKDMGSGRDCEWNSKLAEGLSTDDRRHIKSTLKAAEGDIIVLSFGHGYHSNRVLGQTRLHCASLLKVCVCCHLWIP
jgi:hypothetical protein